MWKYHCLKLGYISFCILYYIIIIILLIPYVCRKFLSIVTIQRSESIRPRDKSLKYRRTIIIIAIMLNALPTIHRPVS